MTKLRLADLTEDKPVRVTVELPASVYRDLVTYAEVLNAHAGQHAPPPQKLIAPMIARFIATDRASPKRSAAFRLGQQPDSVRRSA